MSAAVATFDVCLAIISGSYWLFVVRPEERAARAVRRRLSPERATTPERSELTKKTQPLSAVRMLDTLLTRSGHVIEPLQQSIALASVPVTAGMVVLACALAGTLVFVIAQLANAGIAVSMLLAIVTAPIPFWGLRLAARKRLRRMEEQFPQAIDQIAVSLRAGHAFTTGLLMVAEEVPDPIGAEFRLVHDQQKFGKPLPDVLKEFTRRVPLLDARIFVTAVLTQRETGGNLAEVLDKLAALIRERFNVRRQVRAVSAHGRITGWVLVFLPSAVAAALYAIAPQHLMTLVTDPLGVQLLVGAVVLQIIGTFAIRRIVNVEL
jgi:tight adherence protein B